MREHHHFITAADGSRVAWGVAGPTNPADAPDAPALLLCNGLTTNTHFWRRLLAPLEVRHRVVTWDLKGHGDSGPARTAAGASIEGVADDALRVLDAAGVQRAVVCGFSMGCEVAVEIHHQAKDRVRALALLLGPAGRVFDTALGPVGGALRHLIGALPGPALSVVMPGVARIGRSPLGHSLGHKLGLVGPAATAHDLNGIVGHWGRLHAPSMRHLAMSAARYDGWAHLDAIRVPTLILAGDLDVFAPTGKVGARIRERVRHARLVRMPHGTHASMLEHADEVLATLERFLADDVRV